MRPRAIVGAGVAIAAVVFGAALIHFARTHWGGVYDDALIYLRYVKNLDAGCGLRFNCDGPPVEGFTSPLYLLLLWLGGRLTSQLIALCEVVDTLCLAAAAGLAVAMAVAAGRRAADGGWLAAVLAVCVAGLLGFDHFVLLNAINGMETALAAAAVTAIALAAVAERRWLLVGLVGASVLVRPECMVFVVALPILPALRKPRYLIVAVSVVVAIALARHAVFGVWAPNTYYAKSGGTWRHAELGLAYLADAAADFPLAMLAPLALLVPRLRRAAGFLLVASCAWLAFFLRSGGDLFEYSRLAFPLVPMLYVLALVGIAEVAQWLSHQFAWHGAARLVAPAIWVTLAAGRATIVHDLTPQGVSPRVVEWAAIGSWLRTHYPHATVATVPIGAIGYYSGLPIIDLVGLTEPDIARSGRSVPTEMLTKLWIGHERNCTECVLARAPQLIVTTERRDQPWRELSEARTQFYADWLLLQEIKAGRAPYQVRDAEVSPGVHILMFERTN